ncbi:hypothetical protein SSP35_04_04080 [Streptomyces sp. NBRC 110611]|uniref:hypothetical protein n=1 Tax=Streptomyces sp. NBRC 110611 TaxID=1621259 RepID=UPI000855D9A3|nr:hypothetical protein [Streptomyces sp. NBRC 110611]GAU67320.1 hypothetical protein SSP35_04_04080 [Streptomyces sp. NBRC 110611]
MPRNRENENNDEDKTRSSRERSLDDAFIEDGKNLNDALTDIADQASGKSKQSDEQQQ